MITEIALLNVRPGKAEAFLEAFAVAQQIIEKMNGYLNHELQECIEEENKYLLIVHWKTVEDHTVAFRQSKEYQEWKKLLHHFYDPFPVVEHYKRIY